MGLEIIREAEQAPSGTITTDRRLYLSEDRNTVLEDGDPKAGWLLAAKGHAIPGPEAKRLGLTVENGVVVIPAADKKGAKKEAAPDENKLRTPGENKGGK
jgi:hypothetical protein